MVNCSICNQKITVKNPLLNIKEHCPSAFNHYNHEWVCVSCYSWYLMSIIIKK
jgi:uncharacterized protein with PIN domain